MNELFIRNPRRNCFSSSYGIAWSRSWSSQDRRHGKWKALQGVLVFEQSVSFFLLHILTCLPLHFYYSIVFVETIGPVHFNPLCASFNHIFSFTFHGLIEQNVLFLPVEPASQTLFACSFISATCSVLSWGTWASLTSTVHFL